MEIKINKEIRAYQESIFFGLSFRQLFCSVCAIGVAVVIYFLLSKPIGKETVSWLCIVGAAPIAAAGFFKYNGLTVEKFVVCWLKSEFLFAGKRLYKSENYYQLALADAGKPKGFNPLGSINFTNRSVKNNDKNAKK